MLEPRGEPGRPQSGRNRWILSSFPVPRADESGGPSSPVGGRRILLYSHDGFGLGHLRRCLRLAARLSELPEVETVLIVTGSPKAQGLTIPPGCDSVKLPAVTKEPDGRYRSAGLRIGWEEVLALRSRLIRSAAHAFGPDLVLVDHAPVGLSGELVPLLRDWGRQAERPRLILGLRDIIDTPQVVDREWRRLGAWPYLERLYDRILVYGDPIVLTTAEELGLPDRLAGRLRFCGYLGRGPARPGRSEPPTILVTTGGGGDGAALLSAYASFLEALPGPAPFRSVVVSGPFLPDSARSVLGRYREMDQPIELLDFVDGLDSFLSEAAGLVGMAGYNTVVEALSARVPALLMPRRFPRREQLLRVERLVPVADVELCPEDGTAPDRIGRFVEGVLGNGGGRPPSVRLDGLDSVTEVVRHELGKGGGHARRAG